MARLNWTQEARDWVKEIYTFIAQNSPRAAKETVSGIYQKSQILSQFPRIGARYESVSDYEIRILLYGHYRIVYRIISDEEIDVIGVFHGSMDIEKLLP